MTSHTDEPTLADVQRQYPAWRCWPALSGLFYARRVDAPATIDPEDDPSVEGEDPLDLRDQITRAEALENW